MTTSQIVEKQRAFFQTGKTIEVSFRKAALYRLQAAIKSHENEIFEALKKDLHKSSVESYMTEVGMTLSELSYVIRHIDSWVKEKAVPTPLAQFHAKSFTIAEPYGVTLIMSPWNYPFMLTMEPLIGAICAGNCCVVKLSEYSPNVSSVISHIISEIFPKRYVAVIEGGRKENEEVLNERFDYIFFTGSVSVGKLVMEKASEHLTPVTLELGGKSPCVVDETANLSLAAKRLVFGKFLNSGQTCVAPDYLLIQETVKDEFLHYVKKWIKKQYGEAPLLSPDYPKMINKKHFDRVKSLMEQEEIVIGGDTLEESLQIAPTVLDHVSEDAPIMQEEIFGPVLPVLTFKKIEEAEQFIKEREKPLALYLFTGSKAIERRFLKHVSFGGGCINDTIIHLATSAMGFGGVGNSGMGSYHGKLSFETFSHRKSIVKKYTWLDLPIRYQPYKTWKEVLLRIFLR